MTKSTLDRIVLPALRGIMGNRVYYSCLMSLPELASRVSYALELHSNKSLSDMIQRTLEDSRSRDIAAYLKNTPERFFNSLVVASYDGEPNWFPLSDVKSRYTDQDFLHVSDETIQSVGFLTLRGDENLFALDGQHRLAGIKRAIREGMTESSDEVSVLFLEHRNTAEGLRATRRLFTTLNKTARPVSKNAVIALDEDDVMAICVRRLIEESRFFEGRNAAFVGHNNMPPSNVDSLTTIGNLYDVLGVLFSKATTDLKKRKSRLQKERPADPVLVKYVDLSMSYFAYWEEYIEEIREYFKSDDKREVVGKYRGRDGGSVLFRPVGLEIFTQVIAQMTGSMSLEEAVRRVSRLPRSLSEFPYDRLMWDSNRGTVSSTHKVLVRDLLLYLMGSGRESEEKMRRRYRQAIGEEGAQLPAPIGESGTR